MHGSLQRFRGRAKAVYEAVSTAAWAAVAIWEGNMRISARNQLQGKIVEVTKGATTAHVKIGVGGTTVTSSITNEAVDELGLKVGDTAFAVIKASDVMVGKD
jgi:molybdopterin-binding protein